MEITYQGRGCVRLRGRDVQVLVDPDGAGRSNSGIDIVVSTTGATDVDRLRPAEGRPQLVSGPGEFEVRGVAVRGFPTPDGAMMRIVVDDVRVVAVGKLSRQLSEEEIDDLGHVDVLLVPVGGNDVLTPAEATRMVRAVEPAIVVPIHHAGGGGAGYEPVEKFTSEMGVPEGWTAQPKLNLTGSSGPTDETRVVVLERRG